MALVTTDRRREWGRVVAGGIAIWVLLVGLILLEIVPNTPRSVRGWALLLLAGPPIYLAVSWLGERLARIAPARFSFAWFAWMVVLVVFGSAVVALSGWWFLRFR